MLFARIRTLLVIASAMCLIGTVYVAHAATSAQATKRRAAGAAPLTAEQLQHFDAGKEIYTKICVACHQPDGRGKEKIGANLVGSEFALAPAEVPIRIVLNGKQGPVGLMAPLGAALNDQQIADVLTYVRREWGNKGKPVDAETVQTVRSRTSDRTRPWTEDELRELMPAK
jgi:mono/diheme cytochrome c family protein